jgi:hypothetical protein
MIKESKQLDVTYMKVTGSQPVSEFVANDTIYRNGALQVRGGAYIEKGLKIGNQEQVCNGMLFYDGENFYGHSEKLGTTLLSNHTISSELPLPLSIFENMVSKGGKEKKYTITAAQNNLTKTSTQEFIGDNNQDKEDQEEKEILKKNISVDIMMKDIKNFYIIIPQIYQNTNFDLQLRVTFLFDENSYINDASLHILNQTSKKLYVYIDNDSRYVYYETNFTNIVKERSVCMVDIKRITPQFLLISSSSYHKI